MPSTSSPLLATKLRVPRTRRTLVPRPRLLTKLDEGFRGPLTLVAAPAGFGKTTLLSDWIAQTGHRIAWVSLDEGDDDPARFWAYVIAALETLQPGIGESALTSLESVETTAVDATLTALINTVAALPWDFGLVFDDYHVIENIQVHSAITFLANHLPEQMHLVLATRSDPALPLAAWRAQGRLTEIRIADLRFTADEATRFLNVDMGLNLAVDDVVTLESRTEGWIAGLQLAGLAIQSQDAERVPNFIAASATSNRFVVDYLVQEVLSRLDVSMQDFLRQTSILNRFSAPLCEAVTGRTDGQAILDYLERANLFVVPLDMGRGWYRYHHLFAEVLRKELQQHGVDLIPELHHRASLWYEEHNYISEAIDHALAAHDDDRAAPLIERSVLEMVRRGEVATLMGWLAALPQATLHSSSTLCICYAAGLIMVGELDEVELLLRDAEHSIPQSIPASDRRERLGLIAASRALLAARSGDVPRIVDLTREALAYLPNDRSFPRNISSWVRGLAYIFAGETAAASQTLGEIIVMSQAAGNTLVVVLATCAFGLLTLSQGYLSQAAEIYRRALQLLEKGGQLGTPIAGLAYLGIGDLLRLQNNLDTATRYVTEGLRLTMQWGNVEAPVQGYITLAWLRQARGDAEGARDALYTAEQYAQGRMSPGTSALLQAHQAWLAVAQGHLALAERWEPKYAGQPNGDMVGISQIFVRPFEVTTRARLLLAQGRHAEAMSILETLSAELDSTGWLRFRIGVRSLQALGWQACGDVARALAMLEEALKLAEPEGYIRIFVDEGQAVAQLLAEGSRRASWRTARLRAYVEKLQAAFASEGPHPVGDAAILQAGNLQPSATGLELSWPAWPGSEGPSSALIPARSGAQPAQLIEPLSGRELQILDLLAQGLSNREMAERLYLSIATIKTHVHHIYEKLDVQDRHQALVRAREMHLL